MSYWVAESRTPASRAIINDYSLVHMAQQFVACGREISIHDLLQNFADKILVVISNDGWITGNMRRQLLWSRWRPQNVVEERTGGEGIKGELSVMHSCNHVYS